MEPNVSESESSGLKIAGDAPRRNVELKARLPDIAAARRLAAQIATQGPTIERQVDTYFHCHQGRLKLRQINDSEALLVSYARADQAEAKPSDYRLVAVAHADELKSALAETLGIKIVVDKRREIFLRGPVRIHLDQVAGLGSFLEFEAVLDRAFDERSAHVELADLQRRFEIRPADLLEGSYADLLVAARVLDAAH